MLGDKSSYLRHIQTVKCQFPLKQRSYFINKDDYTKLLENGEKGRLKCNLCEKSYSRIDSMRQHLQMAHYEPISRVEKKPSGGAVSKTSKKKQPPSDNPFPCQKCGQSYGSSKTLLKHVRTNHQLKDVKRMMCFKCDFGSQYKFQLKRHCLKKHEMSAEKFEQKFQKPGKM